MHVSCIGFVDGTNRSERCLICTKTASKFAKLFKNKLQRKWLLHVSHRQNIHKLKLKKCGNNVEILVDLAYFDHMLVKITLAN